LVWPTLPSLVCLSLLLLDLHQTKHHLVLLSSGNLIPLLWSSSSNHLRLKPNIYSKISACNQFHGGNPMFLS
jgi:hypothetical protein